MLLPCGAVCANVCLGHPGVTIRSYKVIYDLIDDMRAAMEGRLSTVEDRIPLGTAEVRAVFGAGSRRVAGCMVTDGKLAKEAWLQVIPGPVGPHYE
jgi:translation initiation factor IF-2